MALYVLPSALTELGVSCRGGHSVSRVDSRAHYFPIQDLPPVCLHVDSPAQWSQHIISLSALFALAPSPLLLCSVGCIISSSGPGPSQQGHASTSHVSSGHPRLSISSFFKRNTGHSQRIPLGLAVDLFECGSLGNFALFCCFYQFTNKQKKI